MYVYTYISMYIYLYMKRKKDRVSRNNRKQKKFDKNIFLIDKHKLDSHKLTQLI